MMGHLFGINHSLDLRVVVSKSHDLHHPMKEELQEQTFVVPDLESPQRQSPHPTNKAPKWAEF